MADKNVTEGNESKGFVRKNAQMLLPCFAAAALAGAYALSVSSFEPSRNARLVLGWVYILGCLMAGGAGIVMLASTFRNKPSNTKHVFACQVAGAVGVGIYLLLANTGLSALPH
jgi:hypothetical protein